MTAASLVIPDLAGKAVLITGGSTGIGAAVARGFAGQGARVAIGYHSSADAAHALASEIKSAGGEALAVKGDVADSKACARIVAETTARFGRLDGLINNAGLMLGRVHSLEASIDEGTFFRLSTRAGAATRFQRATGFGDAGQHLAQIPSEPTFHDLTHHEPEVGGRFVMVLAGALDANAPDQMPFHQPADIDGDVALALLKFVGDLVER